MMYYHNKALYLWRKKENRTMARRNIDLSVVLHGDNDYEDRQNIPQAAEGFAERLQGFHADY